MKLIEAMEQGEKNPDKPLPIHAGRCEKYLMHVPCGADGRWWWRHQFRCAKHKTTP